MQWRVHHTSSYTLWYILLMMKFNAWYSLEGFKQSECLQDSDARFQLVHFMVHIVNDEI